MRGLLDTHIWLWSVLEPERLSRRVRSVLENEDNELWLSPVSTWELVLLIEKGRVVLNMDVEAWTAATMRKAPLKEAPITHEVALETRHVRLPHQDPADRILVATARVFDLTLITADKRLIVSRSSAVLPNK